MEIIEVKGMAKVRANPGEYRQLIDKLTLKNTFTEQIIELYEAVDNEHILIPRGTLTHPVVEKSWDQTGMAFTGDLRPQQKPLITAYQNHIQTYSGGIIKADTGTGKTVIGISIMAGLGYKTLVIVPTNHLIGQWQDRLKTFSSLKDKDIGYAVQNTCDYKNKSVVIGMIHSLSKPGRYPAEFYEEFGLVVWDEIHRLAAPTFSQTAKYFWSRYRLGLSATPRRKDGLENAFIYNVGNIVRAGITQCLIPNILMFNYNGRDAHHGRFVFRGELHIPIYTTHLAGLPERNNAIGRLIMMAYAKDRNILVLSDRINQLDYLEQLLERRHHVPKEKIGKFTGSYKYGLDRNIILASYGSAGLGADIPRLDTVVFATPRTDVEQAVGRILRAVTEKHPLVIDIVDQASVIMQKWGRKRRSFYDKKGYAIREA